MNIRIYSYNKLYHADFYEFASIFYTLIIS